MCSISDRCFHDVRMRVIFMPTPIDLQSKIGSIFYYGL
jgi:hypothetical protein